MNPIAAQLSAAARLHAALADDAALQDAIARAAALWVRTLRDGGKILFVGNGGSAADAQHLAGELVGRFLKDRAPLAAMALTVNTSILTALANDFGGEYLFARQVAALGRPGDLLVALTTSGASPNILAALRAAREGGLQTMALTGRSGGPAADLCDLVLAVPSDETPRIQEAHILIGHILCERAEGEMFP